MICGRLISPSFDIKTKAGKLDSDDAKFVDIVHSNAGKLGYFGLLGHVDFYPNGGILQPNCSILSAVTTGNETILHCVPHATIKT